MEKINNHIKPQIHMPVWEQNYSHDLDGLYKTVIRKDLQNVLAASLLVCFTVGIYLLFMSLFG